MPPKPLILFASSEMYPFSKTGGLGDVMGALPLALHRQGVNVAVITPFYGRLRTAGYPIRLIYSNCPVGYPWAPVTADIYLADYHGMPVYLVERYEFFDRRSYYNTHKGDYFDNCERFIFFCRAALSWARELEAPPAVIHAHDWQAGMLPAFIHFMRQADPFWADTRTVMTIHNLAFQGRFSSRLFWESGLPHSAWHQDGCEFWGDFNLLKAGIAYADVVTAVSPSYAKEIVTPAFGCGLEGILARRSKDLVGILNGADYDVWDPACDRFLPATYGPGAVKGKARCKAALIEEMGLSPALMDRPLLGFIGRLREQKGIDLLLEIAPRLMELNVGIVILGEGAPEYEAQAQSLCEDYPGLVAAKVSYTEDLAHRIQAGVDIFLMPSRYEPCGLTQIYSLRYGTPPVATHVGGLIDTIVPYPNAEATGFMFDTPDPDAFYDAVAEAVGVWTDAPQTWSLIRNRAMQQAFTWDKAARHYINIYRSLGAAV